MAPPELCVPPLGAGCDKSQTQRYQAEWAARHAGPAGWMQTHYRQHSASRERSGDAEVMAPPSAPPELCVPPLGAGCDKSQTQRYQAEWAARHAGPAGWMQTHYRQHSASRERSGDASMPQFAYDYWTAANIQDMSALGFFERHDHPCSAGEGLPPIQTQLCPQLSCRRQEGLSSTAHAQKAPSACNGGSIISLVVGDALASAALCMQHQLRRVGSVCPYVLVYDLLSEGALERLRRAFGPWQLIALVDLQRAAWHNASGREAAPRLVSLTNEHELHSRGADGHGSRHSSSRGGSRRLWELSGVNPTTKVYLYALPAARFPVALVLDVDLLILTNPDGLLRHRWHGAMAAEPCWEPMIRYHAKWSGFNTGYFLLRPDPHGADLRAITQLMSKPIRDTFPRVCESVVTDQSKLNAAFAGRVSVLSHAHVLCQHGWYHFAGEPKPWAAMLHNTTSDTIKSALRDHRQNGIPWAVLMHMNTSDAIKTALHRQHGHRKVSEYHDACHRFFQTS
jgi:hypothetical protein